MRKIKGDLRLDLPDATLGPFAQREATGSCTPGDPDDGELWRRIIATDPDEQMPPPESRHEPLSELQRQKMKEWISREPNTKPFGLSHPIKRPLPEVSNPEWMKHPIDRWVMKGLEQTAWRLPLLLILVASTEFDLTGLPPSLEELTHLPRTFGDPV